MAFENGAAAGAAVGTAAIPIPGVGTAIGGLVGGLLGGGVDKNAIRDQQEAARFAAAKGGDLASAQGIYHDSLPANKQTAERIKDDQQYWAQLQTLGWTVSPGDTTGSTVKPPQAKINGTNAAPNGGAGQPSSGTLSNIFGQVFGNGTASGQPAAGTQQAGLISGGTILTVLVAGALVFAVVSAVKHKGK